LLLQLVNTMNIERDIHTSKILEEESVLLPIKRFSHDHRCEDCRRASLAYTIAYTNEVFSPSFVIKFLFR
jgi:hypothetical protein